MYIGVVLRKRAPMCDIELVALDLHIWVANRLVQCTLYNSIPMMAIPSPMLSIPLNSVIHIYRGGSQKTCTNV